MRTINITDFVIKSPTLAKVIVSYTGEMDADYIRTELSKKLDHLATPVKSSFKRIREGVAVGFIRANKAIRAVSGDEIKAGYRVMSSNILMDNQDKSLWEVRDGVDGKYLARHGQEDLTALVEASVQRRTDTPRVGQITIAKAAPSELVAFVDDSGDVDHGFAFATNDQKVKVLSYSRRIAVTVDYDNVVSIYPVAIPAHLRNEVLASMTNDQKKNAKDYYSRLYNYNPEYLQMVMDQIDEGTLA